MFDGTKIRIRGRAQRWLRSHPLLKWQNRGPNKAGRDRYAANWGGFTFTGDAHRCTGMRGSFHKAHQGGTNWQDFPRSQFMAAVRETCMALGLHPGQLALSGVEFGVNIMPPIPTPDLLRSIVMHRTQPPQPMHKGTGIEIPHAAYRFKIYDKARQYDRPGELLRFELKVTKMRTVSGYGLRTLADLLDPAAWVAVRAHLLARFDELLIVGPDLPTEGLSATQGHLLAHATEPGYWMALDKFQRSRNRRALAAILARQGDTLKAQLRASIAAKSEQLCDTEQPFNDRSTTVGTDGDTGNPNRNLCTDGHQLTAAPESATFAPTGNDTPARPSEGQSATFAPHVIKGAKVAGSTPDEGGPDEDTAAAVPSPRRCLACGADIGHQKPDSKYCSERLKGRDGKSCRNRGSNFTRTLRALEHAGPLLFNHRPYLRKELGPPTRRRSAHHR